MYRFKLDHLIGFEYLVSVSVRVLLMNAMGSHLVAVLHPDHSCWH